MELIVLISNVGIILLSISISSTAHLLLKKGMLTYMISTGKPENIFTNAWVIAMNPWIIGGIILHMCALAIWLWALSRVDLSVAYPFLAIGYVLVSLASWVWFGEEITSLRILGMGIVVFGVLVLAKAG
jgi:multidrug transporter EmrE-like cation transporter